MFVFNYDIDLFLDATAIKAREEEGPTTTRR